MMIIIIISAREYKFNLITRTKKPVGTNQDRVIKLNVFILAYIITTNKYYHDHDGYNGMKVFLFFLIDSLIPWFLGYFIIMTWSLFVRKENDHLISEHVSLCW